MISSLSDTEIVSAFEDYIQFFEQPHELSMFIPCKDGEPMEKPSKIASFGQFEYQEAESKVLFEGWRTDIHGLMNKSHIIAEAYKRDFSDVKFFAKYKTIEDLINAGIDLIPTKTLKNQLRL